MVKTFRRSRTSRKGRAGEVNTGLSLGVGFPAEGRVHKPFYSVPSRVVAANYFGPDGQSLAATGDEGILTIWQLDTFDTGLLERLINRGLNWCKDYLATNATVQTQVVTGYTKTMR